MDEELELLINRYNLNSAELQREVCECVNSFSWMVEKKFTTDPIEEESLNVLNNHQFNEHEISTVIANSTFIIENELKKILGTYKSNIDEVDCEEMDGFVIPRIALAIAHPLAKAFLTGCGIDENKAVKFSLIDA